jgi:hypothetical protein
LEASLRHQLGFETTRGAHHPHLGAVLITQRTRNRKRGDDMATRAAASDQDAQTFRHWCEFPTVVAETPQFHAAFSSRKVALR